MFIDTVLSPLREVGLTFSIQSALQGCSDDGRIVAGAAESPAVLIEVSPDSRTRP